MTGLPTKWSLLFFSSLLVTIAPLLIRDFRVNQELLSYLHCVHQWCDGSTELGRLQTVMQVEPGQAALLAVQQKDLGLANTLLDRELRRERQPIAALTHACVAESQRDWHVAAPHFEEAAAHLTGIRQQELRERATLNYVRAGASTLAAGERERATALFQQALQHFPSNLVANYGIYKANIANAKQAGLPLEQNVLDQFHLLIDLPEPESTVLTLLSELIQQDFTLPVASQGSLITLIEDAQEGESGVESRLSETCQQFLLARQFHNMLPVRPDLFAGSLPSLIVDHLDISLTEVEVGPNLLSRSAPSWSDWTLQYWTGAQDPLRFPDALFLTSIELNQQMQEEWYRIQGLRSGQLLQEEARAGIYSPPLILSPGLYVLDLVYSTSEISLGQPVVYLQEEPRFVAEQYGLRLPPTKGEWKRLMLINRAETASPTSRLLLYSSAVGVVQWRYVALHRLDIKDGKVATARDDSLPISDIISLTADNP